MPLVVCTLQVHAVLLYQQLRGLVAQSLLLLKNNEGVIFSFDLHCVFEGAFGVRRNEGLVMIVFEYLLRIHAASLVFTALVGAFLFEDLLVDCAFRF